MKKIVVLFIFLICLAPLSLRAELYNNTVSDERTFLVTCVPGLFNDGKYFQRLIEFLNKLKAQGYNIIINPLTLPLRTFSFDQEVTGKIQKTLGERTLQEDAKFVEIQIQTGLKKIGKPAISVVAAHSRGALLALMVADQNRDVIDRMILLNPAMPDGISSLNYSNVLAFVGTLKYVKLNLQKDWGHGLWKYLDCQPAKRSLWATEFGVFDEDMEESEKLSVYGNLKQESTKTILQLAFDKPTIGPLNPELKVLVIGGEKDRLIQTSAVDELALRLNAKKLFFNTAHYSFWGFEGGKVAYAVAEFIISN